MGGLALDSPVPVLCQTPRLLVITLNEGGLRIAGTRLRSALETALTSACSAAAVARDAVDGIIVARQESCAANSVDWDDALSYVGFPHQELKSSMDDVSASLALHLRCEGPYEVAADSLLAEPSDAENGGEVAKGIVAAAVRLPGPCNLCLGSFHLDGKVPDARQRVAPLPAALLRVARRAGPLHVALLAGDVNCTLAPEAALDAGGAGGPPELPSRLADNLARASALPEHDAVVRLDRDTREALQGELASRAGRARLQHLDGCPEVIHVGEEMLEHGATSDLAGSQEAAFSRITDIGSLRLVPMPSGSFLTYRLCGRHEDAFEELDRGGRGTLVADGVRVMSPSTEVTVACIDSCYFYSKDGKAGAVKKRGAATRLQLGWLDRLYVAASGAWRPEVVQGDPLLLQASDRDGVLDHLLVPWLVRIVGAT